jgi:Tol biopolymer transport system component
VRNLAGGDAIKITNDAYDDVSPSWSSDGSRIAYIAQKPGEPCRIMVASVPAGEVREAGRCGEAESSVVSWQPGTSFLYYYDFVTKKTGVAIFRLDLDTGARLEFDKRLAIIRRLQCAPDGKSLLYVWGQTAATDAMVIRDLASGEEKTLGKIIGRGSAAWSEDSRAVLASTASGIGSEITAYPIDGSTPYHVYAATISISHLAAGGAGLLAVETDASRENLARASPRPVTQPDLIDPVNGRTWSPSFAPDGTLDFLSNRSGTNAVWTIQPGGTPTQLFDAGLVPMFRIEFSPDGTKLAAAIAKADGVTVKILTAAGASMASFDSPTLGLANPTWMPDSKDVILWDRQVMHTVRIAVDNPAQRIPVIASPPWGATAIRDNGIFAVEFGKPGLWRIDKGPTLISAKYPNRFEPPITFRGDDVLVPDFNAPGGPRILAQPLAGGADRVLAYAPGAQFQDGALMSKMAVNPRTGEIIYVAAVQGDTNIDLLTLAKR